MEDFDQVAFDAYLDSDASNIDPSEGHFNEYDPEALADLELHNLYHPDGYHG